MLVKALIQRLEKVKNIQAFNSRLSQINKFFTEHQIFAVMKMKIVPAPTITKQQVQQSLITCLGVIVSQM